MGDDRFSNSNEYSAAQAANVEAAVAYILLADTSPSAAEVDEFADRLEAGSPLADFIEEILDGPEVADRLG